jgi:uncharacterized protein YukE
MQGLLGKFLREIELIGDDIIYLATIMSSKPIRALMYQSAFELTDLGFGVRSGIAVFAQAFVEVVERWKKTDAKAAASVSFDSPSFEGFVVPERETDRLEVNLKVLQRFMENIGEKHVRLEFYFDDMDKMMEESKRYWQGQAGDLTRQRWKTYLEPQREKTKHTLNMLVGALFDEHEALKKRDSTNFVH